MGDTAGERFTITRVEDVEALDGPGSLIWRPVRQATGIGAFGINAYTADRSGQEVVEPHDETNGRHEEIYVVLTGSARFVLDGAGHDVAAGGIVAIPDPTVHRSAVALEEGTTVLAVGAPQEGGYRPSAWEWSFRADAVRRQDPGLARSVIEEGMERHPEDPWLPYNLACLFALEGLGQDAVDMLARAVSLGGDDVREAAREDEDFAGLREDEAFRVVSGIEG